MNVDQSEENVLICTFPVDMVTLGADVIRLTNIQHLYVRITQAIIYVKIFYSFFFIL